MDVVQDLKEAIVRDMEERYNFPSIPLNDHEQLFIIRGHKAILVSFAEVEKLNAVLSDGSLRDEDFREEQKEDHIFDVIREALARCDEQVEEKAPEEKTKKKAAKKKATG